MKKYFALLFCLVIILSSGSSAFAGKILFIGMDAATWTVMDPMVAEGRLPNIKALMDNGSYGVLRSMDPMDSPVLWTTIATGKTPEKHGIKGFVERVEGEYETALVSRNNRKVKAIWNILSEKKKKVGIINWWVTHPAEKVDGFLVANTLFFNAALSTREASQKTEGQTYPPSLLKKVRKAGAVPKDYMSVVVASFGLEPRDLTDKSLKDFQGRELDYKLFILENQILGDESVYRIAKDLFPKYRPDFFAVYFEGTDIVPHFYWKYMEPEKFGVSPEEAEMYGGVIRDYYAHIDEKIGGLVKAVGEEYTVIIASDHGMTGQRERRKIYDLNFVLNKLGFLEYKKDGSVDWKRTRAFNLSKNEGWMEERDVFANLAGREKAGRVKRGNEYLVTLFEVKEALEGVTGPDGRAVFDKVEITGGAGEEARPDIKVVIKGDLPAEGDLTIKGSKYPMSGFLSSRFTSGGHSPEGVIIASGKGIKQGGVLAGASIIDMAPTMLALMGVPPARDMDGRVLVEMLENAPELATVETYETPPPPAKAAPSTKKAKKGSAPEKKAAPAKAKKEKKPRPTLSEEEKEKLRSLGYIQ